MVTIEQVPAWNAVLVPRSVHWNHVTGWRSEGLSRVSLDEANRRVLLLDCRSRSIVSLTIVMQRMGMAHLMSRVFRFKVIMTLVVLELLMCLVPSATPVLLEVINKFLNVRKGLKHKVLLSRSKSCSQSTSSK